MGVRRFRGGATGDGGEITVRVQNGGLCGSAGVLTAGADDLCDGAARLRVEDGRFCGLQRVLRVENLELRVEDAALRVV